MFIDRIRKGYDPTYNAPFSHDQKRFDLLYHCVDFRKVVENCDVSFEDVANVWNGTDQVLHAIIQGPLGADRMDFLLRDSLYTSTRFFGEIALDYIIQSSTIKFINDKYCLCYEVKSLPSICSALLGRFQMYKQVYYHKTSCAAGILIYKMLRGTESVLDLKQLASSNNTADFTKLTDSYVKGGLTFLSENDIIR